MMNIREYFKAMQNEQGLTCDEMIDIEDELYELYDEDFDAFKAYMTEHNVDLSLRDEEMNKTYLTLWVWDMCGD